ncbi:pyridoxamine 5'-phosphate oxidase family protein [Propioniciclava sp. MC1595]|uniref:pyridoxamine 5'-phosphate oxidase family protein n=1 Tax=Propioniciclava sp. MC1595 TaxID=2760308 RepID=UPI0016622FD9|nr:pyridoxamine 5'-phosphate oxidase family protein [Propioniciclava sp. MC1595]MBB1493893.1 pyridoxamine 5'-phosphate oxidase family protein [Propioniciclava sp. MC1595]QTE24920.1 pyridoxamine 5'-phosphate oxidase family protein [Propioniciclava sp. MC1595]
MTTPHDTVQELDEVQAWEFLTAHRIGRLAIVIGGEPDIFPVNYVVDGQSLVFRTAEGSKLLAASLGGRMAFQVDEWTHEGAVSVLAHGTPHVMEGEERESATSLELDPWVPTHKEHWVRLEVDEVTGRRFRFGPKPEPFHPVG